MDRQDDYNVIAKFDELAADIWRDKIVFEFTYVEIAEHRELKSSFIKQKFSTAKCILAHKEQMWLSGRSTRAKHALLQAGFTSKEQLYDVVSRGVMDLGELPNIGDKTRDEIRRWLFS